MLLLSPAAGESNATPRVGDARLVDSTMNEIGVIGA
jgi:hypothetical protein